MTPLPELDRGALGIADLAFMEEPVGTPDMVRVEAAIRAYLWALENTQPHPMGTAYPSLNDYRETRSSMVTP